MLAMDTMANTNYFLVLGTSIDADESVIDSAFLRLSEALKPSNFMENFKALEQASKITAKAREAHTALKDKVFREKLSSELKGAAEPYSPDQLKPFLGHVCVAAGIISYEELMEAVRKQTDIDLPLGQILQDKRLISQTELEGMLMGQKLYGAPMRPLESNAKRLLLLELVTLDMVKIALIDQRTSQSQLDELLCRRGWVESAILRSLAA